MESSLWLRTSPISVVSARPRNLLARRTAACDGDIRWGILASARILHEFCAVVVRELPTRGAQAPRRDESTFSPAFSRDGAAVQSSGVCSGV